MSITKITSGFYSRTINRLTSLVAATALIFLVACSGGGADVQLNPSQPPPTSNNYVGPPPTTNDVQSFKINVWDNLSPSNRCGQCHGIGQTPEFVNLDDVNLAYSEANTIVDLASPKDSRMVTKVAAGHNCWLTSDTACADIITSYITAWAGDSAGSSNSITLEAPPIKDPGDSRNFPTDPTLFGTTIHPLLVANCANCHTDTAASPIAPFFANSDVAAAYEAAKAKIDLDTPANSRFVLRLRNEFHNCWSDCGANATEMENAIAAFAGQIPLTQVDPNLLKSKALFLSDGIVASGGGRYDASIIALWNFKTGSGSTAFDTSGVEPAIDLNLSGEYSWVGGWGVNIVNGKGQGTTSNSKKLHDLITATGEYSIEAWVVPANVTQEGPAGIISYSAGTTNRNFTLGQTLYNYDFLNRSTLADQNGLPQLSTADADEILQTSLQHVVATFSPTEGRMIYVNGVLVASDDLAGGSLADWNDTYAFVIGNEVSSDRSFAGTFRMIAIHNRALTQQQVMQNFDVGVGEKFFMLFSISHLVNLPDSYIMYEVSQYDSYSYLFTEPTYINLDPNNVPNNIDIEKIRIAINGQEAITGQAYSNLASLVESNSYSIQTGQLLSRLGTVISLEKGPVSDEFFLTFEKINGQTNAFVEPPVPPLPPAADLTARPDIGIRDFAEINATMSQATGVSMSNSNVMATYLTVKQQLPTLTDIDIFVSSQQMGVTQLAISYCNELVNDTTASSNYFSGFNFAETADLAFNSNIKRNLLFDPLISRSIGTNLLTQPNDAEIKLELNNLTDKLTACGTACDVNRTATVVKAVCATTIANAAMLVQ
ncbi:MAG: LamG domain-containing protein [Enterobacterales bacterium]|nr:LamG domain-containing protein [Enterobacterales bacterium]